MIKNIKIERIKDCRSEHQINTCLYSEDIEKHRDKPRKISRFIGLLIYSILIIGVLLFPMYIILVSLLSFLGILFVILYIEIIKEKIIVPMYKDLYENGYYMSGYVIVDDNIRVRIDKYFYNKDDSDKVIEKIIDDYQDIILEEKSKR